MLVVIIFLILPLIITLEFSLWFTGFLEDAEEFVD